jgi:hypothetical protein
MKQQPARQAINLADLVRDAFDFLKVEFGADKLPPPQVAIDQSDDSHRICYDPQSNIIFLQSDVSGFYSHALRYMIGEEVGHYIHHQITPQLVTMQLDLNAKRKATQDENEQNEILLDAVRVANCIEFIGSYAGLLYMKRMVGDRMAREFALDSLKKIAKILPTMEDSEFNEEGFQCAKHTFGYLNAVNAFLNHGNRYLKAAARVDKIETIRLMMKSPQSFLETLG